MHTDKVFDIKFIDCSGICEFSRCPTKYMLDRLIGLQLKSLEISNNEASGGFVSPFISVPKASPVNIALDYGKAIHLVMDDCYNGRSVDDAIARFNDYWSQMGYGATDDKRNPGRAALSLRYMSTMHKLCPYELLKVPISAPSAEPINDYEVPFLIDIGAELPLAGRLDAAVKWLSTGDIWALDYKTTSEISARYFNNFNGAVSTVLYTVALAHLLDADVQGMIIEAIRVSASNTEAALHIISVTNNERQLVESHAQQTAHAILYCNKCGEWPQAPTGCSSYSMFGQPSGQCHYRDICQVCNNLEDAVQAPMYVIGTPYSPFEVS